MEKDLTKKPIPGLIRQIAIPASMGFIFNTFYNVVDTYYGGLISTEALAALSITFPVFFILIALASGISTGATALISNALGKKNKKQALKYSMQSISFGIIISMVIMVIGWMAAPFLFGILGATGSYLEISTTYINIILLGAVFMTLNFIFNSILTAQGDAKSFRNFLIAGFFLNLALDPLFIYGYGPLPGLGFAGVAWATILIQFIGTIYLMNKIRHCDLYCKGCHNLMIPDKKKYLDIAKQGFPAGLNSMTVALGIFIITYFLADFGKEAVAAYGIATRIEQIALLPMAGINISVLAIVGQNNGAKLYSRIKETIYKALKYGITILIMTYIPVFIFADKLMYLFTQDMIVVNMGAQYLRIAAFISFAYTLLYVNVSALQAMKRPFYALWMGLFRQIVGPAIIFPIFAGLFGLAGIWWGIFATVWGGALFTVFYVRRFMKKEFPQ